MAALGLPPADAWDQSPTVMHDKSLTSVCHSTQGNSFKERSWRRCCRGEISWGWAYGKCCSESHPPPRPGRSSKRGLEWVLTEPTHSVLHRQPLDGWGVREQRKEQYPHRESLKMSLQFSSPRAARQSRVNTVTESQSLKTECTPGKEGAKRELAEKHGCVKTEGRQPA